MGQKLQKRVARTLTTLDDLGALLVGRKKNGSINVMAIGWGLIGWFWSKPTFVVASSILGSRMSSLKTMASLQLTSPAESWEKPSITVAS